MREIVKAVFPKPTQGEQWACIPAARTNGAHVHMPTGHASGDARALARHFLSPVPKVSRSGSGLQPKGWEPLL